MFVNLWQSVTTEAILPPFHQLHLSRQPTMIVITLSPSWEHAQQEECTSKIHQRQSVSLIKSATWLERLCLLKLHQFLYEVVRSSPMTLERGVLPIRDSSILQHRLQSMSQALDFNVVINISHASHATPTQMSGK
uniref:Uncharacterized protein n=1 Tax=Oryza rufipogon TaxID=4529 RepID=A0A0E0QT70_ORYRU